MNGYAPDVRQVAASYGLSMAALGAVAAVFAVVGGPNRLLRATGAVALSSAAYVAVSKRSTEYLLRAYAAEQAQRAILGLIDNTVENLG